MIYSIPSMPGIRTWNAEKHVLFSPCRSTSVSISSYGSFLPPRSHSLQWWNFSGTSRLGSLWSRPDPHPSFRRKARSRHKMWRGFPYFIPDAVILVRDWPLWSAHRYRAGTAFARALFFFSSFPKPYYFAQHPAGRSGETAGIVVWSIPLLSPQLFFVAGNSALS